MSMVVNNNSMAANVARNLNAHYGRLSTSTQRLSTGLRVNSGADDAAGLAIRELQRADIAALNQGVRNANDAISMIQVADGALGIIDEKLIRMKELAEQAATGTYDSTQRLMIESEYQQMASEITRIANATDFNGTHLLDGTLAGEHDGSGMVSEGKMKVHFGTGNDSAEDYYYVEIDECTSAALGLGNSSTWQDVQNRGVTEFKKSLEKQIREDKTLDDTDRGKLLASLDKMAEQISGAITDAADYNNAYKLWGAGDGDSNDYKVADDEGFLKDGKKWVGNSDLMERYMAAAQAAENQPAGDPTKVMEAVKKGLETRLNAVTAPAAATTYATSNAFWELFDGTGANAGAIADAITTELNAIGVTGAEATAITDAVTSALGTTGLAGKVFTEADVDVSGALDTDAEVTDAFNQFKANAAQTISDDPTLQAATAAAAPSAAGKEILDSIKDAVTKAYNTYAPDFTANPAPTPTKADADFLAGKLTDAAVEAATAAGFDEAGIAALKTAMGGVAVGNAYNADAFSDYLVNLNGGTLSGGGTGTDAIGGLTAGAKKAAEENAKSNKLDEFWNELRTTEKQKLQYAWGQAALYNLANAPTGNQPSDYGLQAGPFDFGTLAGLDSQDKIDAANAMLDKAFDDMQGKVGHMDFAGHTIETQEDAQNALNAINDAIVSKDKIRAYLGATQNRLENTVSNLSIQAENLQAAESRISDVDVATEMTQFVRNQILTQSAVAMLSQANSMPQMAMQLIG